MTLTMAGYVRLSHTVNILWLLVFFEGASAITCPGGMTGLDKCDCKWNATEHKIDEVICINLGHTNHYALRSLEHAQDVTKLVYTGNDIVELESNIFGNCSQIHLRKLIDIDFSNNGIQIIHGQSFHCVPNVRILKLNNNLWNVDPGHVRVFSSMSRLEHLELNSAFRIVDGTERNTIHLQTVFDGSHMSALRELQLEGNEIQFIASKTFCQLPNLIELHLNNNKLTKINLECLDQLRELYIRNNQITSLTKMDLSSMDDMQELTIVDLGQNPYQCNDCSDRTAYFRDWLTKQRRLVVEKSMITCTNHELIDKRIVALTNEELKGTCEQPESQRTKSQTREVVTGVILGIIAILTVIVLFINRKGIKKSTAKCIEPIRNSSIIKRMHFGYRNMHNDEAGMFGSLQNEDDATFSTTRNDDATTYATMDNMDNEDAANYANMPHDDTAPVVT